MPSDNWNGTYFDEEYSDADPWDFESSTYEQTKYRQQNHLIAEHVTDPDSILELGCAEGVHTQLLLDTFSDATVHGVDISETAIERARDRVDSDRATFDVADAAECVDSLEARYDVVVCSETIYYVGDTLSVPEMNAFVGSLADRLTDDGLLCMANIHAQTEGPEKPLTREPVLAAYRELLTGVLDQVHRSRHTNYKSASGREHTYELWGFTNPSRPDGTNE